MPILLDVYLISFIVDFDTGVVLPTTNIDIDDAVAILARSRAQIQVEFKLDSVGVTTIK
jgi:hypothetical protein